MKINFYKEEGQNFKYIRSLHIPDRTKPSDFEEIWNNYYKEFYGPFEQGIYYMIEDNEKYKGSIIIEPQETFIMYSQEEKIKWFSYKMNEDFKLLNNNNTSYTRCVF